MWNWSGRVDREDGAGAVRWHQRIRCVEADATQADAASREPGLALCGFACDEGVRRNKGRPGAARGPEAIRKGLSNLAWHHGDVPAWDFGDVACREGDLAAAQEALSARVAAMLGEGHRTVVLGGGHEIAVGSFGGFHRWARQAHPDARLGIVNLDAHFDLRRPGEEGPSSGTPFLQIHDMLAAAGEPFRYCCLGVAGTSNTAALFDRAGAWGVSWRRDTEMTARHLPETVAQLERFLADCDLVYLTIDLDVLPHGVMPGVSAPAARGVPLEVVEALIDTVRTATGRFGRKMRLSDLAELNPEADPSGVSARVAALLCDRLMAGRD